jgi:predicted Zn-dependent peptidase
VSAPHQVEGRQIYLVNKPEAEQTEIRMGRIGVERKHPDYFPIIVMNTILGGSFTSRLNQNLRERNGYSYGAGSGFDFRQSPGAFTASSAVQTDVTDKALHEFMNELAAIRDTLSDEELVRAKNYIALQLPKRFETVSAIASQLGQLVAYDLPDDYYNTYVQKVMAVTAADVHRVASERIDPTSLAIIVVGDRSKIEPGISALQLGAIHHYEVKDVLGDPPAPAE